MDLDRRAAMIAATCLCIAGCSTVETAGPGLPTSTAALDARIQLKVRTGDPDLDAVLYDAAFLPFSTVMPLRETGPFTGTLEITFTSVSQSGFGGAPASNTRAKSAGWYSGRSRVGLRGSRGLFTFQDSVMEAVLKGADGERLWAADYAYHGGWELSGFTTSTPAQAARLVARRLAARYAETKGALAKG